MGARCGNNDQSDGDRVLLHPVFRNGSGLGKSTGRTWLILGGLGLPVTVKEIAEAGGDDPRTLRRHLSKLEQHGLAMKCGTRWKASGDDRRLDQLAMDLGAEEQSAIQAERYERNREGFRMAPRFKEARRASSVEASADAEPPTGRQPIGYDDEIERLAEEDERLRSYQEQELLRQLGLPNE